MRNIQVSTDVFAQIWSLRQIGEESEDAILRRVLSLGSFSARTKAFIKSSDSNGLSDQRFGVVFPEGFQIQRTYLGNEFRARVQNGQWVIEDLPGRFSKLNELSRAIGTKNENAWMNWFFIDRDGQRQSVSILRKPQKVSSRPKVKREGGSGEMFVTVLDEKVRWCDDVYAALQELGGKAHLRQIYRQVKATRRAAGRSTPSSLEEVIRKELEVRSSDSEAYDAQRGEDWFTLPEGKGSGVWALRESRN